MSVLWGAPFAPSSTINAPGCQQWSHPWQGRAGQQIRLPGRFLWGGILGPTDAVEEQTPGDLSVGPRRSAGHGMGPWTFQDFVRQVFSVLLLCKPVGWRQLLPAGPTSQARELGNGAPWWLQPSPAALPTTCGARWIWTGGVGEGVSGGRGVHAGSWGHTRDPDHGPVWLEGSV